MYRTFQVRDSAEGWTVVSSDIGRVAQGISEVQARAVADLLNKIEPKCLYEADCHGQGCPFHPKNCPHAAPHGAFIIEVEKCK